MGYQWTFLGFPVKLQKILIKSLSFQGKTVSPDDFPFWDELFDYRTEHYYRFECKGITEFEVEIKNDENEYDCIPVKINVYDDFTFYDKWCLEENSDIRIGSYCCGKYYLSAIELGPYHEIQYVGDFNQLFDVVSSLKLQGRIDQDSTFGSYINCCS